MSETDIYKNKERIPTASGNDPRFRKGHRRRSSNRRSFDEPEGRRRRSKNAGLRRLLHLTRKGENEKPFWLGLLVAIIVILVFLALWQYWYLGRVAREQARENDLYVPVKHYESATE